MSTGLKFLVYVMGVAMSACALTKSTVAEDVLADDPHGAVVLHTAQDGWFRTAHPFDLSPEVLAMVLQGVRIAAEPSGTDAEARVFSDDDIRFVSPLMSTALSKATRRQVVGFRVIHDLEGRQETTGGFLYVQGRLLHLTLTHYRAQQDGSEPSGVAHRLNPNPTGLNQHQITFAPEAARRSSRHEQLDVIDSPPLVSLVLDYEALIDGTILPPTSVRIRPIRHKKGPLFQQILDSAFPLNEAPASHNRQIPPEDASRTGQALGAGKEAELEALREEVRKLQRRLSKLEGDNQRTK